MIEGISSAKILFFSYIVYDAKKNCKNYNTTIEGGGAKRRLTLFFTLCRKWACLSGLGVFGAVAGVKLERSGSGGIGKALPDYDFARYHFPGVGKMITEGLECNEFSELHMNQSRRVVPGLHFPFGGIRYLLPCCASGE